MPTAPPRPATVPVREADSAACCSAVSVAIDVDRIALLSPLVSPFVSAVVPPTMPPLSIVPTAGEVATGP
jgi:hypothetical protein